jgi:hypothetical protein
MSAAKIISKEILKNPRTRYKVDIEIIQLEN